MTATLFTLYAVDRFFHYIDDYTVPSRECTGMCLLLHRMKITAGSIARKHITSTVSRMRNKIIHGSKMVDTILYLDRILNLSLMSLSFSFIHNQSFLHCALHWKLVNRKGEHSVDFISELLLLHSQNWVVLDQTVSLYRVFSPNLPLTGIDGPGTIEEETARISRLSSPVEWLCNENLYTGIL